MIKIKSYSIPNNITLTNEMLVSYINHFWKDKDIFNDIKDTSHLLLMCKVHFTDDDMGHRTLGNLRKVNFNDKDLFIDYLTSRLSILNDSYVTAPISEITFSYVIKSGQCADDNRALLKDLSNKMVTTHRFNNMELPTTMNPNDYGDILVDNYVQVGGESIHRYMVRNGTRVYTIDVSLDTLINHVTIEGAIELSWIDTKISSLSGSDIFKREIRNSTIYFMDGIRVLRKQLINAKPFRRLNVDTVQSNDFYTMDIETINQEGKLTPYLICAYNGKDYITSFGKDQKELFDSFFNNLLSNITGGTTIVYAHNLSSFDGIFMLKHTLTFGKIEPLIHNGKLISIKIRVLGKNKSEDKTIIFKDSYLLLPFSLRSLCKSFGIIMAKGYFPFKLSNIFYTGVLPKFEYWTGISLSTFESLELEHKNKFWSFQQEAIKYCKLDCQCLHEIITKFKRNKYKFMS